MVRDHLQELGPLALASRLKRLSDRMMQEVAQVYQAQGQAFEPAWFPLFTLVRQENALTLTEASSRLGVSHAAISQTASALRKAGLLTLTRDPKDGRSKHMRLTVLGERQAELLEPVWLALRQEVMQRLDRQAPGFFDMMTNIEEGLHTQVLHMKALQFLKEKQRNAVMVIDYRPEHRADFERLNRIWLEADFAVEPIDAEMFADPHAAIIKDGGHIFIALLDGIVVGTCALLRDGEHAYELIKMGVDPAVRGKQVGKALMEATFKRAREIGAEHLHLLTSTKLLPAHALYRSFGFRDVPMSAEDKARYVRGDMAMEVWLERENKEAFAA